MYSNFKANVWDLEKFCLQAEVADQQTTDLPAENGETENQRPASEAEEKEATHQVCECPHLPSCIIQRNIFINYFVNVSFLVALETFLKGGEKPLLNPFFKCK